MNAGVILYLYPIVHIVLSFVSVWTKKKAFINKNVWLAAFLLG